MLELTSSISRGGNSSRESTRKTNAALPTLSHLELHDYIDHLRIKPFLKDVLHLLLKKRTKGKVVVEHKSIEYLRGCLDPVTERTVRTALKKLEQLSLIVIKSNRTSKGKIRENTYFLSFIETAKNEIKNFDCPSVKSATLRIKDNNTSNHSLPKLSNIRGKTADAVSEKKEMRENRLNGALRVIKEDVEVSTETIGQLSASAASLTDPSPHNADWEEIKKLEAGIKCLETQIEKNDAAGIIEPICTQGPTLRDRIEVNKIAIEIIHNRIKSREKQRTHRERWSFDPFYLLNTAKYKFNDEKAKYIYSEVSRYAKRHNKTEEWINERTNEIISQVASENGAYTPEKYCRKTGAKFTPMQGIEICLYQLRNGFWKTPLHLTNSPEKIQYPPQNDRLAFPDRHTFSGEPVQFSKLCRGIQL